MTSHLVDAASGSRREPTSGPVVAVVLAAGSALRFGATKPAADLDGVPLVAHVVAAAHAARVDEVVVVVGHDADAVVAAARRGGVVTIAPNPRHRDGQATSLAAGLAAAGRGDAEVAVVLLADEPDVTADAIVAVAAAVGPDAAPAARARYDDGPGHPVAFARAVWGRVAAEVGGDRGARDLLADLGVVEVAVTGPRPVDLDTVAALEARRRRGPGGAGGGGGPG